MKIGHHIQDTLQMRAEDFFCGGKLNSILGYDLGGLTAKTPFLYRYFEVLGQKISGFETDFLSAPQNNIIPEVSFHNNRKIYTMYIVVCRVSDPVFEMRSNLDPGFKIWSDRIRFSKIRIRISILSKH